VTPTDRVILAVKYTPVTGGRSVRRAVGGFLRYVQYRDKHADGPTAPSQLSGMLKYVAYRDRTGGRARLFDAGGPVGDEERRRLATFVGRAVATTRPQLAPGPEGKLADRRRAVYRFVVSPEHAAGLDLPTLTRAAMERLAADTGGDLRWIAAEHRNTAHPHVHIVLAGFREVEPGNFRSLLVTKQRLARMKEALAFEIERQRELTPALPDAGDSPITHRAILARLPVDRIAPSKPPIRRRRARCPRPRRAVTWRAAAWGVLLAHRGTLRRLALRYRLQAEWLAEVERRRLEREGMDRA